jgi:hypothetical protein
MEKNIEKVQTLYGLKHTQKENDIISLIITRLITLNPTIYTNNTKSGKKYRVTLIIPDEAKNIISEICKETKVNQKVIETKLFSLLFSVSIRTSIVELLNNHLSTRNINSRIWYT